MKWLFERKVPVVSYIVLFALLVMMLWLNEQQRRQLAEDLKVLREQNQTLQQCRALCASPQE